MLTLMCLRTNHLYNDVIDRALCSTLDRDMFLAAGASTGLDRASDLPKSFELWKKLCEKRNVPAPEKILSRS